MSDRKISEFSSIAGAGVDVDNDYIEIVDSSAAVKDRNKRITPKELIANASTITQSGTGAVSRTAQSKMRDEVHIRDFGGVCDGSNDDTSAWNAAEAARPAGSRLIVDGTPLITGPVSGTKSGIWELRCGTITSTAGQILTPTSNFRVVGAPGRTNFVFTPGAAASSLNRAIRVAGVISTDSPGYGTTGTIAVNAMSFVADDSAEAALLSNGDWIFVVHHDVTNWVRTEIKQVLSVSGTTINVTEPFRQAFDASYTIEYVKFTTVRQNVWIENMLITIADTSQDNVGFDGQPGVVNSGFRNCAFNLARGNAWSVYGWYNPTVEGFDVLRQQGKRCAWSSNTGGVGRGIFREGVAVSTNGALTVETGSNSAHFEIDAFGSNAGAAVIYHNNAHLCTYDKGTIVGNGTNIGILVQGGSENTFGNRLQIINATEGISIIKDTVLTPTMNSDRNRVLFPKFRNCTTAVRVVDANCNDTTVWVDTDSTVTTPISDVGTNTHKIQWNSTVSAYSFLNGIHVGNAANANANVLDQYTEVTTLTPTVTFGTVGDLAVTYSTQTGSYTRIGNRVFFEISVITSAFTYTTASGSFLIGGLPLNPRASIGVAAGAIYGWTSAGYGQAMAAFAAGDSRMLVKLMGSGKASTNASVTEFPTGSTINIRVSGHYDV